jgi:hypothetical protein
MRPILASIPALILSVAAAHAHDAPTGWSYDPWCCGGHDCQPISSEYVEITENGFLVTLPEGSHITARRDHERLFGYDDVRHSEDMEFHACILPRTQEFRCLYVPPFGF